MDRVLAAALESLGVPCAVACVVIGVGFVGWVIVSEPRTRHLTQLIEAFRGVGRRGDGRAVQRRNGR